jgi:hypothetical protein
MLVPQYFLGDIKNEGIVIEKIVSPLDAFVFGDTIYDISMGFPFDEFLTYFIPLNLSVDDYILNLYFEDSDFTLAFIRKEIMSVVESQPEQKKRIDDAIIRFNLAADSLRRGDSLNGIDASREFFEQKRGIELRRKIFEKPFGSKAITGNFNKYRCRE